MPILVSQLSWRSFSALVFCVLLAKSLSPALALCQEQTDASEYERILTLSANDTQIKIAPNFGANVFSIRVKDTEFLHQPGQPEQIAGVRCGVPILYPMPNRVRDAKFSFDGQEVSFPKNAGSNFIHGLVNEYQWEIVEKATSSSC